MLNAEPVFGTVALIGVGLIGSSLARATRAAKAASTIVVSDASAAVRARVKELGFADLVLESSAQAVADADLVILCVPVGAQGAVAADIAPALKPGAIVSDVGSVKAAVVREVAPHLPPSVHFVPAHPVAGTENSGPDAGFAELFEDRWSILTPPKAPIRTRSAKVQAFGSGWAPRSRP